MCGCELEKVSLLPVNPILQLNPWNLAEVFDIIRDHDEVMGNGGCTDEQVKLIHPL